LKATCPKERVKEYLLTRMSGLTLRVISNAVGTNGERPPCYHFSYTSFKGYQLAKRENQRHWKYISEMSFPS